MTLFYSKIEQVFEQELSPELIVAAAAADKNKYRKLVVAWKDFHESEKSNLNKETGHIRPYYPNYFDNHPQWTTGGIGLDFSDLTDTENVWKAVDALKLRLLYCHSVAIDDPAGPIIDQLDRHSDNEHTQHNYELAKLRFANYINLLFQLKPLIDSKVIIFVPYKFTRDSKLVEITDSHSIDLDKRWHDENWDFADINELLAANTGSAMNALYKEVLSSIAKTSITRISAMSNLTNGQVDYYFAFEFWNKVFNAMVEERIATINQHTNNVYQLQLLNCLTKLDLPNITDLKPSDVVAIRNNSNSFHDWRVSLQTGLQAVAALNINQMNWQNEATRILRDGTHAAKSKLEEEIKSSGFLKNLKSGSKTFALGAIGSVAGATIIGTSVAIASILGAGIGAALGAVTKTMKSTDKNNVILQHYVSIS